MTNDGFRDWRSKSRKSTRAKFSHRLQVGITPGMWEQLTYLADQEEMTPYSYVRMIFRRHIKENME